MNGPEHYREAERLISMADQSCESADGVRMTSRWDADALVAAQVHATLALAAATAAEQATRYDGDENYERTRGWAGVA